MTERVMIKGSEALTSIYGAILVNKGISVATLVIGIVLIIWGVSALESFRSDMSQFFTGSPTDKAVRLMLGGIAAGIVGLFGLIRSPKGTYAYEHNFEELLKRSDLYAAEVEGTPEAPLVYYWTAVGMYETGDVNGALKTLDEVINSEFDTQGRFKYVDVKWSARKLAAKAHFDLGQIEQGRTLLNYNP